MKPVVVDMVSFDPAMVSAIRVAREQSLFEGLVIRDEKKHKSTSKRTRKKPLTLDTKTQTALNAIDDTTKAFLLKMMGR